MKFFTSTMPFVAAGALLAGCAAQQSANTQGATARPVIGSEPVFSKGGAPGCPGEGSELSETAEGQLICLPPDEGCPDGELVGSEFGQLECRPPEGGCPENADDYAAAELSPECRIRRDDDGGEDRFDDEGDPGPGDDFTVPT